MPVGERNFRFIIAIAEALQLDSIRTPGWLEVKRAITPQAVRAINEAIVTIWPPSTDLAKTLERRDERQVALYSGDYRPERLLNAVGRHLIYADVVALADPFPYPLMLRDEYSPLLHPSKHITNTAKNLLVWFQLAELLRDGLVEIIRLPSDFDARLNRSNLIAARELTERHTALKESVEKHVRFRVDEDFHEHQEWFALCHPDEHLAKQFLDAQPGATTKEVGEFLSFIQRRRDAHPFYVGGVRDELVAETTGATVYDSAQVASISGAYLLTDLEPRWQQFQFLQREAQESVDERVRVARSLQNLKLPMAAHLNLGLAKQIRDEGQLERVRGLLNKLMRQAGADAPLSEAEAQSFQHELTDAVAEAKHEYASIDRELLKFTSGEAVGVAGIYGMTGGSLAISLGAAALAGGLNLVGSAWARRTFKAKYPAAMFMNLPTDAHLKR